MTFVIKIDCDEEKWIDVLKDDCFEIEYKTFGDKDADIIYDVYTIILDGFKDLMRIQKKIDGEPSITVDFCNFLPTIYVENA